MGKPLVILLHGIARSDWDMYPLQLRLEKRGYDCLNIKYPSTKHSLEDLSDIVNEQIENDERFEDATSINFVAHSMGGVLTRYILAKHRPEKLGRVVMMGTPNQGSHVADFLMGEENGFKRTLKNAFKRLWGPAGHQLGTNMEHVDGNKVDYDLGVIASDISLNPLQKHMFDEPNDTLVSVEATKLDGMSDHIIIPSTHSIMMFDPRVTDQVIEYLKNGSFDHKDDLKPENLPDPTDGPA